MVLLLAVVQSSLTQERLARTKTMIKWAVKNGAVLVNAVVGLDDYGGIDHIPFCCR